MSKALPFRLISELDRAAVARNLHDVMQAWAQDWFPGQPAIHIHLQDHTGIASSANDQWIILGAAPDAWFAWKMDGLLTRELLGMMFDSPVGSSAKTTPLMLELLKECVSSLADAIFKSCGIAPVMEPERQLSFGSLRVNHGSGALLGELQGAFPRQCVVFGGEIVARVINQTPGQPSIPSSTLSSRTSAIGKYPTSLEVTAGQAEMTLHDLAHLGVGDVIRLDTTISEPFCVRTTDGLPVAKAHLGLQGSHKAVQFIEDEKYAR